MNLDPFHQLARQKKRKLSQKKSDAKKKVEGGNNYVAQKKAIKRIARNLNKN